MYFSVIIPVYNRPDEVEELLESLIHQTYNQEFEVVLVEDGSTLDCKEVAEKYANQLTISYYFKENSGPGDSRNFGMKVAKGDYFLILDSDCILPNNYLSEAFKSLQNNYVECFGGIDKAQDNFTDLQKAINFAMTSVLTTGGVRGASESLGKFQPRSFNMGISKKAFLASGGFDTIHPGEDPDLSIRLWELGFNTKLFKNVYVYHKRRISWEKFKIQVNKFGKVRPILNSRYPKYNKLTYFFPSAFLIGLVLSIALYFIEITWFLKFYINYFIICFLVSSIQNKSLKIGLLSVIAVFIQFYGYGSGFIKSFYYIQLLKKNPKDFFPELFFEKHLK